MLNGDFMKIVAILFVLVGFFSMAVYARPNPDEVGICYLFDGNKLKQKDTCIISSSYSFGYAELLIKFKNKEYYFGYNQNLELADMAKKYGMYKRDVFYQPYPYDDEGDDYDMECFKQKPYDVCYRVP